MPLPGGHPVHLAGIDGLEAAQAVAMKDLALEQIGDRGQADMGVRANIDAFARAEHRGTHLVPENEGPDHLALRRGQGPADLETAEIPGAGHDHRFDGGVGLAVLGCFAGLRVAKLRHVSLPSRRWIRVRMFDRADTSLDRYLVRRIEFSQRKRARTPLRAWSHDPVA